LRILEAIERCAATPRLVIPAGFLVSLLFVLFGPYPNYASISYIDPWVYTGYFTNYAYLQHHYGTMYYFSRLPWTIPGLIAFQLATPEAASVLLNACLVATSSLSLFFAIRWNYGTVPAVLASVALATNPWYFSSVAWDYPDGPAIAYGFLAVAFALRPHGSRTLNTILMAACLAFSGFTNMSGGPMVLSILIFPLWRSRRSLVRLLRECGYIILGVAGATLALLPVSKLLLGYWDFYMPQIKLALYEMGTPGVLTAMWGSGDGFLRTAYHLFPVAFLLVFGLVLLVAARERDAVAWPAYLALLVCSLIYSYQEFVSHGVVLHVSYHSVYLVVPLFVLAGVIVGELWRDSQLHREWIPVTALVLWAMALPLVIDAYHETLFTAAMWGGMFVAGAIAILLVAGWRSAPGVFRVAIALLLMPLLFVGPARKNPITISSNSHNRDNFQALMSFNDVLKSGVPLARRAVFWADPDEGDSGLFTSAQSLWTCSGYDFSRALHAAALDELRNQLRAEATLVHLTDHPERIVEHLKLLDAHGIRYENPRQWTVRFGQSFFYVAAQDITDISAMH
jgi:hypothetical protein